MVELTEKMKLAFFDFDGTLFRSPKPVSGGGGGNWFSNPASLLPPCVPPRPGREWWIEDTVRAARGKIKERHTITVLATGRPEVEPFSSRVRGLLASKKLAFDEVYLKPEGHASTEAWKKELLESLVHHYGITEIEVWEDRHLQTYIDFIREDLRLPMVPHLVEGYSHPCLTLVEPTDKPHKKAVYYEAILTPKSRLGLWRWWERTIGPLLNRHVAHHITLSFVRTHGDDVAWPVGKAARYRVVGWAGDDRVQAVAVAPVGRAPYSLNDLPHTTVALAKGVPAKESNALLAAGFHRVRGPVLDTVVGYYDGAHRIQPPPQGRGNIGTTQRTDTHWSDIQPVAWPACPSDATDEYCPLHKEHYKRFRPGISYEDAASYLRDHGGQIGGGSDAWLGTKAKHGEVLRMMGVLKTNAWRERHGCCVLDQDEEWEYRQYYLAKRADEGDPRTWGWEPDRPPNKELICFDTKHQPAATCFIGARRKPTGRNRPPVGGAECRSDSSGKFTTCSKQGTSPVGPRRKARKP